MNRSKGDIRMSRLPLWLASVALVLASVSATTTLVLLFDRAEAVVAGANVGSPRDSSATGRVQAGSLRVDERTFPNEMVSLTHNWRLDGDGDWTRPEPARPSVSLTLESWYGGIAELNFDMAAPDGRRWEGGRAFGFEAQYDGSYASLAIGGDAYAEGASGVRLSAGTTSEPLLRLRSGAVADPAPVALSVERVNGTSALVVHGGNRPHIGVALDGWGVGRGDSGAAMSFIGRHRGRTIIDFSTVGERTTLLSSRPNSGSVQPAFSLRADGALRWSDGTAAGVVELERSGPNQLRTSGELAANGLVVGDSGTRIASIRVVSLTVAGVDVPRRQAITHDVLVPDLAAGDVLVVNGVPMRPGLFVAGARSVGDGAATLTFVNLTDEDLRAEDGLYTILIIRPS